MISVENDYESVTYEEPFSSHINENQLELLNNYYPSQSLCFFQHRHSPSYSFITKFSSSHFKKQLPTESWKRVKNVSNK